MQQPRNGARLRSGVFALAAATLLIGSGLHVGSSASADEVTVTAVTGSALGYSSSVGLRGQPATARGQAATRGCDATREASCSPSVSLPATGGSELATDPDGAVAKYGPLDLFEAASLSATTQGTTGAAGRVTSSASASDVGLNPFTATEISSTCTADASGITASTAIAGGRLVTRTDAAAAAAAGERSVLRTVEPAPAPNTVFTGTLDHTGDSFKAVFNEQITNPDGSLTVNAYHEYLFGPIAVGDLIVGQSTCGVTAASKAPAPSAAEANAAAERSVDRPAAPEDQTVGAAPQAALGKAAAPAPATPPSLSAAAAPLVLPAGTAGAGAYGFYANVGLFGGPAAPNGPTPKVALPAGGADPALAASDPTGRAQYGPATIYESGEMKVSTQGTATSSTSSASAADVGPTQVRARLASSTCSSTNGDVKGSSTFAGGTVRVSQGPNQDIDTDDVIVTIPDNPAPNTSFDGVLENVGDRYTVVVNEQEVTADGIVVNAVHLKLLGDIAVGDVVIAQSRCLKTGSAAAGNSGSGGNTGGNRDDSGASQTGSGTRSGATSGTRSGSNPGTSMASTGIDPPVVPGLALVALGSALLLWGRSRRRVKPEPKGQGAD